MLQFFRRLWGLLCFYLCCNRCRCCRSRQCEVCREFPQHRKPDSTLVRIAKEWRCQAHLCDNGRIKTHGGGTCERRPTVFYENRLESIYWCDDCAPLWSEGQASRLDLHLPPLVTEANRVNGSDPVPLLIGGEGCV